jgi:hypothetical protein
MKLFVDLDHPNRNRGQAGLANPCPLSVAADESAEVWGGKHEPRPIDEGHCCVPGRMESGALHGQNSKNPPPPHAYAYP